MAKKKTKKKVKKKAVVKKAVKKKKTAKKKKTKAKKPTKDKGGGQTVYTTKHPDLAMGFAEDGSYQISRLAKKFGVTPQTIRNWVKTYPKFAEAVKEGKQAAIDRVNETYHNLAIGGIKIKKSELPPNEKACNKILTSHVAAYKNKQEVNLESESLADIIAKAGILKT